MDSSRPKPFAWLVQEMPGVAERIKAMRTELGGSWVNECWKRGVLESQPGWFWAAEGPLTVGTLWPELLDDPVIRALILRTDPIMANRAMVVLRPKEATHGAH